MEKESKGVTPTDVTRVKKQEEKELKERTKKYDEMLEKDKKSQENKPTFDIPKKQEKQTFDPTGPKNQRQTGIDWKKKSSDASQDLPTTKKMWEEKSGIPEKRSPFKYIKTEKKQAALDILKKAGFGRKSKNISMFSETYDWEWKNLLEDLNGLISTVERDPDIRVIIRNIDELASNMQAFKSVLLKQVEMEQPEHKESSSALKNTAQVSKDLYMKLKSAEDALRALWSALSAGGDPMASVEQQREIEGLLQKMQAWHKELTGGQ